MLNINNISNEKVEAYEENGKWFLRLDFDYEDSYAYYKGHIERIYFDFYIKGISEEYDVLHLPMKKIDLNLGKELHLLPDNDGHYFTLTVIKEKVYEMTIEEIEKKLGHKVKIVAKSK